jgi:biopolymer transport protein ExbB
MQKLKNFTAASLLGMSTLLPLQAIFAEETAAPTTAMTTPVTATEKAATPVPPPLAEKAPSASEKVHNPYGLEAMWKEGDLVSKVTLFILVIMSIGTWYIIITKCLQQGKIRKQGQHADKNFFYRFGVRLLRYFFHHFWWLWWNFFRWFRLRWLDIL